ncbi:hypothetical protein RRG08_064963 [Elysia crispata]|uniref:Uncharacterized protein n=1 Tax=Elysia crispata TaxID=231223 RepID=A0AAE0Y9Y5_9GAST|nr:hypothetical protein RRG08_064963 [Elysia crispata]
MADLERQTSESLDNLVSSELMTCRHFPISLSARVTPSRGILTDWGKSVKQKMKPSFRNLSGHKKKCDLDFPKTALKMSDIAFLYAAVSSYSPRLVYSSSVICSGDNCEVLFSHDKLCIGELITGPSPEGLRLGRTRSPTTGSGLGLWTRLYLYRLHIQKISAMYTDRKYTYHLRQGILPGSIPTISTKVYFQEVFLPSPPRYTSRKYSYHLRQGILPGSIPTISAKVYFQEVYLPSPPKYTSRKYSYHLRQGILPPNLPLVRSSRFLNAAPLSRTLSLRRGGHHNLPGLKLQWISLVADRQGDSTVEAALL